MSVGEAAEAVGVSRDTVRKAIHSTDGRNGIPPLPAKLVGSRYSIAWADLMEWHKSLPNA